MRTNSSNRHYGLIFSLLLLVIITAVSIVYVTHQQRNLFISLQQLQQDKDDMIIEWGKLQLEENTWSTTSRIEKVATKELNMQVPKSDNIIFILICFSLFAIGLLWRVVDLKVVRQHFLQGQSDARIVRNLDIAANRGMIVDRNDEPLAISTPVATVWANPREMDLTHTEEIIKLADLLKVNRQALIRKLAKKKNKSFIYLKRKINPDIGEKVVNLNIKGISLQREYRR